MRIELDSRIDLRVVVHIFHTFSFLFFYILNVWAISEFKRQLQNFSSENMGFPDYLSEFLCLLNFDALFWYCPLI